MITILCPKKISVIGLLLGMSLMLTWIITFSSSPSLATAALLPSGTPSPESNATPSVDVLYEQSRALYQAGRVTAALAKLNNLLEIPSADDADAILLFRTYFLRGQIYLDRGNIALAISDFTTAIGYQSEIAEAYALRASAYVQQEDFEAAIDDYTLAIEYDDSESTHYINRGMVYIMVENYRLAVADFSEAIVLNPDDSDGYIYIGEAYLLQDNYSDALINLDTAIELDPENVLGYQLRGRVNRGLAQNEAAIDDFRTYLELAPEADDRDEIESQIDALQFQLPE